jgi:hypothetical protein
VQAAQMLGLVRAELARILGFKCESITALYEGRLLLVQGSEAWRQAVLFVRFYQALFDRMAGEEARMVNWMRREHESLGSSPFYLMVDAGRMAEVGAYMADVLKQPMKES